MTSWHRDDQQDQRSEQLRRDREGDERIREQHRRRDRELIEEERRRDYDAADRDRERDY